MTVRNNGLGTRMAAAMRPVPLTDAHEIPACQEHGFAGQPGSEARLGSRRDSSLNEEGEQARTYPTPAGMAAYPMMENRP